MKKKVVVVKKTKVVEKSKKAAKTEKAKAGAMFMTAAGAAMFGAALF